MKIKESFKRIDMEAMKKAKQESDKLDALMSKIDDETDKVLAKMTSDLGYKLDQNMSLTEVQKVSDQMVQDGVFIDVEGVQKEGKYYAFISIVKVLKFDLN